MSTAMIQFNSSEIQLLKNTIAKGTTDDQLRLFVQVCRQLRLDPFARQIYAVVRKDKMTIQTSIDGYRLLAQRSGEYAGQDGPFWYDATTKEWTDVWVEDYPPSAAKVGVFRKGFVKPIYAVARFDSYAVREYNPETRKMDGALSNLWAKMPELMIAKVCEALALRRAFPAELSGIYTDEEMQQADDPLTVVVPVLSTKDLYRKGYDAGLWDTVEAFCTKASAVLGIPVSKETKFSPEQRQSLYAEIEHPSVYVVDVAPVVEAEPDGSPVNPSELVAPSTPRNGENTSAQQVANASTNQSVPENITEQQLNSIRKLCDHLNQSEPANVSQLSYDAARGVIRQLTNEYKEMRQQVK